MLRAAGILKSHSFSRAYPDGPEHTALPPQQAFPDCPQIFLNANIFLSSTRQICRKHTKRPDPGCRSYPALRHQSAPKQMPLLHIQIKGGSIVHTAVTAAYDLRHKAAFTHCAQLKNGFNHPQICFALTDHIKAVYKSRSSRCASCPVGERVIAISAIYIARLMPSMLAEMP